MKKTLIALAAVAVSSAAMAQATISGTFNVDMQNTMTAGSDPTVGMGDAIVSVSASEDLGGGTKASANTTFQTKAGRAGTVTNNGYSFALTGGFGGLTLRNY
jgi:predicted porin